MSVAVLNTFVEALYALFTVFVATVATAFPALRNPFLTRLRCLLPNAAEFPSPNISFRLESRFRSAWPASTIAATACFCVLPSPCARATTATRSVNKTTSNLMTQRTSLPIFRSSSRRLSIRLQERLDKAMLNERTRPFSTDQKRINSTPRLPHI